MKSAGSVVGIERIIKIPFLLDSLKLKFLIRKKYIAENQLLKSLKNVFVLNLILRNNLFCLFLNVYIAVVFRDMYLHREM